MNGITRRDRSRARRPVGRDPGSREQRPHALLPGEPGAAAESGMSRKPVVVEQERRWRLISRSPLSLPVSGNHQHGRDARRS
jgi:hypothetical protein